MTDRRYDTFELRLTAAADGTYHLEVTASPQGEQPSPVAVDIPARGVAFPQPGDDLVALGKRLWGQLFPPPAEALYRAALAALPPDAGLRLRLRIDPPELTAFPWELAYDPERAAFLALNARTPLVRYLALPFRPQPLAGLAPLRILFVGSAPRDLIPLDSAAEKARLLAALAGLQRESRVVVDVLEGGATVEALQDALRRDYRVLHFSGHGRAGALALERADGRVHWIGAEELAVLLGGGGVSLALLNACDTGAQMGGPFIGVAPVLVRAGLPAVVAMQAPLPDESAVHFARSFYAALADGWPLDAAVTEGRKAMSAAAGVSQPDWAVPVLYLRAPDGLLFARDESPSEDPEDTQTRRRRETEVSFFAAMARLKTIREAAERLSADLEDLCGQVYGISHIERVLDNVQMLVLSPHDLNRLVLNETECFILLAAACLHTVGLHHPSLTDWSTLSQERLYELSYEVIVNQAKSPSPSLELGLESTDPVIEIAEVILAQKAWPPTIREQAAPGGRFVHLHLLAALLRLALSLEIGSGDESLPDDPELPLALRLQNWLRRYVKAVVIQHGLIRLYHEAPSENYGSILRILVSGPVLHCHRQMMDLLWTHGLWISLAPSQVDISPLSQPMPVDLWAWATDPTYLAGALRPLVDVLGTAKPVTIPALWPYYYGAIRKLDRFDWKEHLPRADDLQYEIRVDDIGARENKFKIVTTELPYRPDSLSLAPGRHYRWRITARRGRKRLAQARGDFWLLTEEEQRAVLEAESRLEQVGEQDAAFAKGVLYMSAKLYGEAVSVFEQLIKAPSASEHIPAHRALAELCEILYKELGRLERFDDADRFLSIAEAHFSSLKDMVLDMKENDRAG